VHLIAWRRPAPNGVARRHQATAEDGAPETLHPTGIYLLSRTGGLLSWSTRQLRHVHHDES